MVDKTYSYSGFKVEGRTIKNHLAVASRPTQKYSLFKVRKSANGHKEYIRCRSNSLSLREAYHVWVDYTLGDYAIRPVEDFLKAQSYNYFRCGTEQ